jgi:hypothetical protein
VVCESCERTVLQPGREVEIMKKLFWALACLVIASAPVSAGPNRRGVIVVHNTGVVYTTPLPVSGYTPCPNYIGVCCTPAGACSVTLQADCVAPSTWD